MIEKWTQGGKEVRKGCVLDRCDTDVFVDFWQVQIPVLSLKFRPLKMDNELRDITEQAGYKVTKRLGTGYGGSVYLAEREGEKRALKVIYRGKVLTNKPINVNVETFVHLRLMPESHINIIQLNDVHAVFQKGSTDSNGKREMFLLMDMEYIPTTFLKATQQNLPLPVRRHLIYQLLSVIYYLHSKNIIHTDVHPWNVYVVPNPDANESDGNRYILKISDFGECVNTGRTCYSYIDLEKDSYRPPDQYLERVSTPKLDIWPVGVMLHDLIVGSPRDPLFGEENINRDMMYGNNPQDSPLPLGSRYPGGDEQELDLLSRLLIRDAEVRLSAEEAMAHPYFHGMSDDLKVFRKGYDTIDIPSNFRNGPELEKEKDFCLTPMCNIKGAD